MVVMMMMLRMLRMVRVRCQFTDQTAAVAEHIISETPDAFKLRPCVAVRRHGSGMSFVFFS